MARLTDLPADVLVHFMYFIADDRSLCRLAQQCHLLNACASDEGVWCGLCHSPPYSAIVGTALIDARLTSDVGDPLFRGWKKACRKAKEFHKRRTITNIILQSRLSNVRYVAQQVQLLVDLDLSQTCIGPQGAVYLGRAFEVLAGSALPLEVLNLQRNEIRHDGAAAIFRPLAALPQPRLVSLNLRGNRLGPDGAEAVAAFFAANHTVRTADLAENFLGPAGAIALAKGLSQNSTLEFLDLEDNAIDNAGVTALLPSLRSIRTLLLGSNGIGKAGAKALVAHLEAGPTALRFVDLSANSLGETATRQLRALCGADLHLKLGDQPGRPFCTVC